MNFLKGYEGKRLVIDVNGHKVNAVVSIQWEYEQDLPKSGHDFDFGNAKENAEYENDFISGKYLNIYLQVNVMAEGLEGRDSLGACHIKASDFVRDLRSMVRYHGMISLAKEELVKQILDAAQRFPKYLTKAG